jgi:hypothetical protein
VKSVVNAEGATQELTPGASPQTFSLAVKQGQQYGFIFEEA